MSITSLSAARIAGEVGLAGATATSTTFAVKYSEQVKSVEKGKKTVETENTDLKKNDEDVREKKSKLTKADELKDWVLNWKDCYDKKKRNQVNNCYSEESKRKTLKR